MRILLHDFGAYGFIVQLARWLAARGHTVLHLRSADLIGPQGATGPKVEDPSGLQFGTVSAGRPFQRHSFSRRLPDELRYGRRLGGIVAAWRPEIVLSANTPPLAQATVLHRARRCRVPFVNWVQDIFVEGAGALTGRIPRPLSAAALAVLRRVEFGAMRNADALVTISDDFRNWLRRNGVIHPLTLVQENWAPSQAVSPGDKGWAALHGLDGRRLLLAAGTLGLKHDQGLLADLACDLADDPAVRVVVVSQGRGRERLEAWLQDAAMGPTPASAPPLVLMDYQSPDAVPAMLAAAEIGIVLLTTAAGGMSVPSKVYTYAAAGLPILASIPPDNHAAHLIRAHGLGLAVDPGDRAGFAAAARRLLSDDEFRRRCAEAGRTFSARHGDIDAIGARFEAHLAHTVAAHAGRQRGTAADMR